VIHVKKAVVTRIVLLLVMVAIWGIIAPFSYVSAQKVSYEVFPEEVRVKVGEISFTIKATGGLAELYIGEVKALDFLGYYPFRSGWSWGAGTWYYGEVIEPIDVKDIENGIIVKTHSRFPPETNCYMEFESTYVIYNTGMIIANLTARAYDTFRAAWVPIYAGFSTDVLGGSKIYFAYGKTITEVNCPKKYTIYRLSSGSFSVAYTSTPYGDLVIICLSPPSLSYLFDDDRRWGGTTFAIKCGLTGFEVDVTKGTEFKVSLMLYPHTKGPEFTKLIVSAFSNWGAAKSALEALKKSKPRTPGGAKLLARCEEEVRLASEAFKKGDMEGVYNHASKALEYAENMKVVERNQRIMYYIVLPNVIELIIAVLVIMKTKPIKKAPA